MSQMAVDDYLCNSQQRDSMGRFPDLFSVVRTELMLVVLRGHLLSYINLWTNLWCFCDPRLGRYRIRMGITCPLRTAVGFYHPSLNGRWWLIQQERPEEAYMSLLWLTRPGAGALSVDEMVAMMRHTNKVEDISAIATYPIANAWRREPTANQYHYHVRTAFNLVVRMYWLAICANVMYWALLPWVGRRRLYLSGDSLSSVILIAAFWVNIMPEAQTHSWMLGSFVIALTFVYQMTLGPVCYMLVAEVPSTRLRLKTIIVGRVVYNMTSIITNTVTPRILNPIASGRENRAFSLLGPAFCVLYGVISDFRRLLDSVTLRLTFCLRSARRQSSSAYSNATWPDPDTMI
ncbi:LOW QUALITY PROTEIN: hypothetical protein IFM46972_11453 [Aspergillus udagawae]|uniref:Uncharacterized protein n=1 Tax=Aspergillus udagawae TaxID=91492 RepID=A0A8H3XS85_9EURO|nr:LOW QUALITY PROTEIN: hypothetical protein IFM46972_11453 [Aspergillus udagawae]